MKKSPHILIAPDAFKESLAANQVAYFLKKGIEKVLTDATFDLAPVADGGEGFCSVLVNATGGFFRKYKVHDALMRPIEAEIGFSADNRTAFIEMAAASGLEHIEPENRNPLITTTFGTGELIRFAINEGCRKIIMGIGGSATNDGGAGMAQALGIKLTDVNGFYLSYGGGNLHHLFKIDYPVIQQDFPAIVVACDVSNPLTGPNGAAAIYGPQKGATPEMVDLLDKNLQHFAQIIREQLKIEIETVAGAGAAGGLGGGLMAFCNARLTHGFRLTAEIIALEKRIAAADFVITGEGRIDEQTLNGKAPFGVAQLAKKQKKPVIGVAGTLGNGYEKLYDAGFDLLVSIVNKPISLSETMKNTPELLEQCGFQIGKVIQLAVNK